MSRRKTDAEFRNELIKKNPNLEPLEPYINSKTKIHSRCKKCNSIVFATPYHMLVDAICCPECVKIYKSEKTRKEEGQFRKEFKEKHPNLTVLDSYVNNRTKVTVLCEDCLHIWKATPHHLLDSNSGCPVCVKYSMEKPVREILDKKNVAYKYNAPLDGSYYNGSSRPLFLDFLIETEKDCLVIETDGKQHFIHVKDKEPLSEIQARDRHKDKLLKEMGLILIRVTSSPNKKWGFKNHITLKELFDLIERGVDSETGELNFELFRKYDFNR